MKRRHLLTVTITVLVLLVLAVSSALAEVSDPPTIDGYSYTGCTPEDTISVDWSSHGADTHLTITNNTQGTSNPYGLHLSDEEDVSDTYTGPMPAKTEPGDEFTIEVYDYYSPSNNQIVTFTCKGEKAESEPPYTGINMLTSPEELASHMAVPNAEGFLPCGVFNVNGWGRKYVGLGDFPGCSAPVTVMCLNADLEWTADNVSDVVTHGDWEVDFTSSQDGYCGLFAQ